ncbi:MAG: adenosine kinase [Candidatus Hydrogenedentota bacterium]
MELELVSVGLACADVVARPVDSLPERGKLTLIPQLEIHLGGLAGVTATVYAALGGRAAFIGALGDDGFGSFVQGTLATRNVDVSHVKRVSDVGTAATVVLVSDDGERSFLHHAGCSQSLFEEDIDFDFVGRARHLHWGGPAVTAGLDGPPMGRVLERAKKLGLTTSMDTCYDGASKWLPRIEPALPHLDIVMSSLEEAREYTGCDEPESIADFFRSYGPEIAMIKLGEHGMFVKDSLQSIRVPAHRVEVRDTTGAGDASCSGFLYGYLRGWDTQKSARFANAIGGMTVQAMGGSEGVRSLEDVQAFLDRASVDIEV